MSKILLDLGDLYVSDFLSSTDGVEDERKSVPRG